MNQEHKNITQQAINIAREAIDLALAYSGGDSETAQELETQLDDICRHSDARLIASAPDLLASLIELESMVTEMLPKFGPCGWGELALEQARAAIAKATREN